VKAGENAREINSVTCWQCIHVTWRSQRSQRGEAGMELNAVGWEIQVELKVKCSCASCSLVLVHLLIFCIYKIAGRSKYLL
jgi:hypothetical protein